MPAWSGSPLSLVAFTLVPLTVALAPLMVCALAKLSLAGLWGTLGTLVSASNMPRPCVAATSLVPIQNSSSTDTFAGPSVGTVQVDPPSSEAKMPTSGPAYSQSGLFGLPPRVRTGASGSPVVPEPGMPDQVLPSSAARQILSGVYPPNVA